MSRHTIRVNPLTRIEYRLYTVQKMYEYSVLSNKTMILIDMDKYLYIRRPMSRYSCDAQVQFSLEAFLL